MTLYNVGDTLKSCLYQWRKDLIVIMYCVGYITNTKDISHDPFLAMEYTSLLININQEILDEVQTFAFVICV